MLYIAYIPDACRCILFSLYTNYDCYRWNGSAFLSINFFLDSVVILAFFSPHDFYHWKVLFIANKVVMHIYRLQNSFILFSIYFFFVGKCQIYSTTFYSSLRLHWAPWAHLHCSGYPVLELQYFVLNWRNTCIQLFEHSYIRTITEV